MERCSCLVRSEAKSARLDITLVRTAVLHARSSLVSNTSIKTLIRRLLWGVTRMLFALLSACSPSALQEKG